MFKNLSIKNKFLVITIGSILVISFIRTIIAIDDFKTHAQEGTERTIKTFIANKQQALKNSVLTAYQLSSTYHHNTTDEMVEQAVFNTLKTGSDNMIFTLTNEYNKYKDKLSTKEMKKHLLSVLTSAKYDKMRTFFSYELDGLLLASFDVPFLEGKNLWDFKDVNGKFVNQAFLKPLQKDPNTPVVVDYYWVDNGETKPTKYLAYAQMFKPLNIVIGTGIGINSVTQREKDKALKIVSQINEGLDDKIFIYDFKGNVLLNPNHKIEQNDIQKAISLAQKSSKNGSFLTYKTLNQDSKMAFVNGFEKWGWMIGVSSSMSDINSYKVQMQKDLEEKISNAINKNIITALVLIVLVSFIVNFIVETYVNKFLQKIQSGLSSFFNYLADPNADVAKQIDIDTTDEFGQMAKMLNENIVVSTKLHEEIYELNTNLEEKVEEKTQKVTTLLDNAGQGFLTFNQEFIIDNEYSRECEKLLGDELSNKNIMDILFNDNDQKEFAKDTVISAINEDSLPVQQSFLSLLPSSIILNRRALKLEYKVLENGKVMLIVTNVTAQKKLEKKVKQEQETLKMIVTVVSDSDTFYDTKQEYEEFISACQDQIDISKTPLHNISMLYRVIHTFKGTFSQLYMQNCVNFLHGIESELSSMLKESNYTNEILIDFLNNIEFNTSLEKDLQLLRNSLGDEFINSQNFLKVNSNDIKTIQDKVSDIMMLENVDSPQIRELNELAQNLSSQKLNNLLYPYKNLTQQLAQRLEKDIYEIELIGDEDISISDKYKPFVKSLMHIFRNCIDHGIETAEERLDKDKDEMGTISCNFSKDNEKLQIIISDDGAGINKEKVTQKALEASIINSGELESLEDKDIYELIFHDNFSTKEDITDISGRGVGMSAVRAECEKLNGTIEIQSKENVGTTFVFSLDL